MEYTILTKVNVFADIEKPHLDDCYICLEPIDEINHGAIFPYRCRHHICILCMTRLNNRHPNSNSFLKTATCGICRATANRYIVKSEKLCRVFYSQKQSVYAPSSSINEITLFRDHIQHMLAHGL